MKNERTPNTQHRTFNIERPPPGIQRKEGEGGSAKIGLMVVVLVVVCAVVVGWGVWHWGFCRFYVDVGQMAIVTSMDGRDLEPGQILAKPGQKGVLEEPLGEGRHFLNPMIHEWKIVPAIRIQPGKVGVVTSKVGKDLPPGEFLADEGQKGVWRRVLGPGAYRINPEGYKVELLDAVNIPIGYVGVVTSLSGESAPDGAFAGPNQKGVRADILQPGLYYLNPNAYKIDVLEIGLNQVSLTGKEGGQVITKGKVEVQNTAMENLAANVLAKQQERRKDYIEHSQQMAMPQQAPTLSSSVSRSAPAALKEKKSAGPQPPQPQPSPQQQGSATFGFSQCVEFPSRDGFEIRLDMTVEFELLPDKIAEIFLKYGDLPAVVDKIIMPQILSVSRLKGSSYRAQDFIVGEGREKFQNELKDALATILKEKDILVLNSLIRHVDVPGQILEPIQQASLAVEQNLTNKARQATARKQAELNTSESLIDQKRQEVMQETEKLVAETKAQEDRAVASIKADAEMQVGQIAQETAKVRAGTARILGEAKASVISMVEGEMAKGFELKLKAISDPEAYNLLRFSEELNPDIDVKVIHAGEGTLWTDLEKAGLAEVGGAKAVTREKKK